jgi:uncharacterized RDD family membrane protein YckC
MTASSIHPLNDRRSKLGHYAGFVSRLIAFMLDTGIISITIVFTSWFLTASLNLLQGGAIIHSLAKSFPLIEKAEFFLTHPVTHGVATVVFVVMYYIFFWVTIGQTPGKYILGLRVVSSNGKRLKLFQAVLRYLGYYLSGLPFGLGFFWILLDDQRRGWHDRLADTCVIYVWDARPDERFLVRLMTEILHRRETLKDLLHRQKQS